MSVTERQAVQDAEDRIRRAAPRMLEALERIACFDDAQGNAALDAHGSYAGFDEPHSVRIARTAILNVRSGTHA